MANPVIEVDFRAQTTKFLQATERVEKKLDRVGKRAQSLGKSFARLAGAAVGAAGVAGIGALTKSTLNYADATIKASRAAGINVETFQELGHAAGLAGIEQAALGSGLAAFNKRLGELKSGTGALSTFLGKYDEGLESAIVGTRNTDEALELLIGRLAEIEDPAERAALAAAAFGRSLGPEMANMLTSGIDGLNAARMGAHELGKVLGKDLLEAAERANDAMSKMGDVTEAYRNRVLLELAPAIEAFADEFTEMLKGGDVEAWADMALNAFEAVAIGIAYFVDGWRAIDAAIDLTKLALNEFAQHAIEAILGVLMAFDEVPFVNMAERMGTLHAELISLRAEQILLNASLGDYVMGATAVEGVEALFESVRARMGQVTDETETLTEATNTNAKAAGEAANKWSDVKVKYDDVIGSAQGLQAEMDALNDLYQQQLDEIDELVNADLEQIMEDMPELFGGAMEESSNVMKDIWGNTIENMQREFANTIYNEMLDDSLDSFGDFADALVNIWKRMIAEMVSAWITSKIAQIFTGEGGNMSFSFGGGGDSSGGGMFQSIASSAIGKKIAGYFGAGTTSGAGGYAIGNGVTQAQATQMLTSNSAYTGGSAAGGGGGGAAAGGAILAAMYALGSWSNSSQQKMQQHYQNIFDTASFKDSMINGRGFRQGAGLAFSQAGYNTANIIEASGATYGGMNRSAFAADGTRFEAITDGIEKAREALEAYTPLMEDHHKYEMAAMEEAISGTMRRDEVESALTAKRKEHAEEFVASQKIISESADEATQAIIAAYGTVDTKVEEVAKAIEDGLITSSEAAAAGLQAGAVGMIASLNAVKDSAELAAYAVSSIREIGGRDGGHVRVNSGDSSRRDGGFATGGIARGPASGYRPLLHGTEAVIPLGNGDRVKAPVVIESGSDSDSVVVAINRLGDRLEAIEKSVNAGTRVSASGSAQIVDRLERGEESRRIERRAVSQ